MPRILLVKLSSLGDIVHNLPVLTDIAANIADAQIDWVCESPYVPLVRLHPALRAALPVSLRSLKANLFSPAHWREFAANRRAIARETYDLVLDTQGLVKSAWVAAVARGPRAGYAADSAREPFASHFYSRRYTVAKNLHAVMRNRALAAQALGYTPGSQVTYGLQAPAGAPQFAGAGKYAVFLHATSRRDKQWPETSWASLGSRFADAGFSIVLPWGSAMEREAATRLASAMPAAIVAPQLDLAAAATLLGNAGCVVGVDTGLAHLSVALGTPTVGVYTVTDSALTGLFGATQAVNLGGRGEVPQVDAVWTTVLRVARA